MKKSILLFGLIILTNANAHATQIKPIKFSSKKIADILNWIDGIKYAMDGFAIKDMEKVKFQIDALQEGIRNPKTKKVVGRYVVSNNHLTLSKLAELEQKGKLPKKESKEVHEVLMQACKDFEMIVKPFQKRVQGLKKFLVDLITESCSLRNRMDSGLLDWSKCDKNEQESFERTIKEAAQKGKGFSTLNTFLTDLTVFFEDLKYNCPKACQQYEELKHLNNRTQLDGKD